METYPTVAERSFNVGWDLEFYGAEEAVKELREEFRGHPYSVGLDKKIREVMMHVIRIPGEFKIQILNTRGRLVVQLLTMVYQM